MTIVNRHSHSRPVSYTPAGTDAAVSYNTLDLVIKNPYNKPLTLTIYLNGDVLTASFEGIASDFVVQHIYSANVPEPFPSREIFSKLISEKKLFQAGRDGIAGTSVWIQQRGGVETGRVVSISRYKPIPEIWILPIEN